MTDRVQVELRAPVAIITLNKPERLNAERKRADFTGT